MWLGHSSSHIGLKPLSSRSLCCMFCFVFYLRSHHEALIGLKLTMWTGGTNSQNLVQHHTQPRSLWFWGTYFTFKFPEEKIPMATRLQYIVDWICSLLFWSCSTSNSISSSLSPVYFKKEALLCLQRKLMPAPESRSKFEIMLVECDFHLPKEFKNQKRHAMYNSQALKQKEVTQMFRLGLDRWLNHFRLGSQPKIKCSGFREGRPFLYIPCVHSSSHGLTTFNLYLFAVQLYPS